MSYSGFDSLELIRAQHAFPGPYIFKMIGLVADHFEARVVSAVRDELALEVDPPFSSRHSASGKHVAVTLTPEVQSAEQVVDVYRRVRAINGLVMML